MTTQLYYQTPYETAFTAQVLRCTGSARGYEVVLDRTLFYPEGGGQPYDTGVLGGVRVLEVHERGGEIVHLCEGPLSGSVSGEIDWARRFDLMQQHSGEHIVSGLIHQHYGYENVGFHMGADTITIDLSGELDEAALRAIEQEANDYLWRNVATEILLPTREELAQIPYRSKKELSGQVRIVRFPGADTCACCGLHVRATGEIGLIRLISCQKFREGVRIEMLCGGRAFRYLSAIAEQNTLVSQTLSAKPMQTGKAVARLLDESNQRLYRLTGLENRLFTQLAAGYAGAASALVFEDGLNPDGVRRLGIALLEQCSGLVAVFSATGSGYAYFLGQTDGDVRALTRSMNTVLHGRGGGKPGFSQGSVSATRAEIEAFFREVEG